MAQEYTGNTGYLRRIPKYQEESIEPRDLSPWVQKQRTALDSLYNLPDDPYMSWKLKRSDIRRKVRAIEPDISDQDLEWVYDQFNLGEAANPGDFSREEGFGGTMSRAGSLIKNNAGMFVDWGEFLIAKHVTGDAESIVQNQAEMEEIAFENQLIHAYSTKDMSPVTQFLFDLTVSAPTMVAVMGIGAVAGFGAAKAAGALGAGAVAKWLAGIMGFNAIEAMTEVGFNYAEIMSDPMVIKKVEEALGKKMTGADKEEIRLKAIEILSDRADDSAAKVALGNFFNPLNLGHTFGAGRLAKLIKVSSGKWDTAKRLGVRVSGREALEEALQSAGSQYTASEAKMMALEDVGADVSFPLRPGTIYGIDLKQTGYEALMGGFVGAPLGFVQGARGYSRWQRGDFDLDKYGNPVRKGDPVGRIFGNVDVPQPGQEGFVPKGLVLNEIRKIVDIPDSETALHNLDQFRQSAIDEGNQRKINIIDEEIALMKQGADLLGEKTKAERTARRVNLLNDFKPGTHAIPDPEVTTTEPVVDETGETVGETTTTVSLTNLNKDPALRTTAKNIYEIPEDQRSPRDAAYIKIANENPELDNKGVNAVIANMEKAGTLPKAGATQKAPVEEIDSYEGVEGVRLVKDKGEARLYEGGDPDGDTLSETYQVGDGTLYRHRYNESDGFNESDIPEPFRQGIDTVIKNRKEFEEEGARQEKARRDKAEAELQATETPEQTTARKTAEAKAKEAQALKITRDEEGNIVIPKKATIEGQSPNTLNQSQSSTEITRILKEWAGDDPLIYTDSEQHRKNSSALKKYGDKNNLPFDKKNRYSFTPEQRLELATEIAANQGITPSDTVVLKQETKAKKADKKVEEDTQEDAAQEAPYKFEPRYNRTLYDDQGNTVNPAKIDFSTQEAKDKIESLKGTTVLHYHSKGHKALNPYDLPKGMKKWRFDGIRSDGNAIFTRPKKGVWKEGQTVKDLKGMKDYALNSSGKHTPEAENMLLHLFIGNSHSFSTKAKGKGNKGKFHHAYQTEGTEALGVTKGVAEGKGKETKRTPVSEELKVLLREAGYTEAQINNLTQEQVERNLANVEAGVATDSIVEGMVSDRKAAVTTPDKEFAETGGDIDARQAKLDKIAEENKKKQQGKKAETKGTSKQQQMKEKLAADRKAKADAKKVTTKDQTPVTPPVDQEVVAEPTEVSTPTLTRKEVEDSISPKITKDVKKVWVDQLMSRDRIKDLTLWDGTDWIKNKNYLAKELREDMARVEDIIPIKMAPPELRKLIQRKITDWLTATATPETFDAIKIRYFPLLLSAQKTAIASAVARRSGVAQDTAIPKAETKKKYSPKEQELKDKTNKKKKPLKKKSEVKKEAEPTGEPTILNDVVKATKKVPYVKPKTPNVWQIFTAEVEKIFSPLIPTNSQADLDSFIESLGDDHTFVVSAGLNKGDAWKIYRLDTGIDVAKDQSTIQLTSLDPDGQPVPSFIKNALEKHGRVLGQDRATNNLFSRKLTREDLIAPPEGSAFPPSDILARIDRDQDVPLKGADEELNKVLASDKPIVWAGNINNLVELTYMFEEGKGEEPTVVNLEFKDEATAERYVEFIKSKNPDREQLQKLDDEMVQQQIADRKNRDAFGEAQDETMTYIVQKNLSDHAELYGDEFQGTVDDYFKTSEPDSEVKVYTDEEIKAYEDTLKDSDTHFSLQEDTVTISPEAKKPTVEDLNGVIENFKEGFPGVVGNIELITEPSNPFYMDKRGIKGAYSKSKDTIYLVADNLASKEDAAMTLLHEAIGHRSYTNPDSQILTNEKRAELESLVKDSFPEEYATEYDQQLADIQGGKKKAIEGMTDAETAHSLASQEVLAHKVEKMTGDDFNPTFVEQFSAWIRGLIRDFFTKIGLGDVKLNDNDVKILFNKLTLDLMRSNKANMPTYVGTATELPSDAMYRDIPAHEKFKNMGDVGAPQLEAMNAMYPTYNPKETSASSWWSRFGKTLIHKAVDPFRVIKDKIGVVPYMQARLHNREDGIMSVLLKHGHVDVTTEKVDGVIVNSTKFDKKGKGLFNLLRPLGGKKSEIDRFVAWVAYKRADKLEKEIGEENLGILRKNIDAAIDPEKGFDRGNMRDATTGASTSRKRVYEKLAKDLANWNKGIVDFGIKMGLFDQESASNWNTDWYLPFFRHFEEEIGKDVPKGTRNYKSLAGQTGIKKLKGSQRALDNPLDNLIKNALHIVSASLKNDSAVLTLEQASKIKDPISGQFLAKKVKYPSGSSLRVIKNGKDVHYEISNEMLYDSLSSMNVNNDFAGMGWAIKAKNLFTRITTASPVFKVRNVLRDTMSAAGTTDVGFNLLKNAVGGWKELGKSEGEMLVSGAYLQFGNIRSDDPNFAQNLLTKDMRSGFIGMNPEAHDGYMNALRKAQAMSRGVWDAYQRWGDKLENANRAAVFKHHMDKGDSQLKAAYEARDLLDFTLHGSARWVNLVTSLTPFANAMLQGKYKTGRALINNPMPVVVVSSAVTMASLAEYFMYEDNEEWQRRQDWDKDMFWWINIPGTDTHFRMPKPHEFNIVANLAWRGLDMAKKNDPVNGALFASAIKSVIGREFNMSPVPQAIKPLIEVGFNENFFFGRPIEPYRFKNMTGKEKRDLYTSETMITMSEAFDWAGVDVSPMDMEHIVNGYFGWVGEMIIGASDIMVSKARDFPDRPAQKFMDNPILRKMFQASPIRNTKASTAFYERMKDVEQAHADLSLSKKLQDWDRYKEIYEEKKDLLKWKDFIKKKQRILNELNKRIRVIRFDRRMGADEKRERMDQLYLLRNQIMDRIAESPALR